LQTYLTLDIGNSHPHLGFFEEEKLICVKPFDKIFTKDQELPILISKVGNHQLPLPSDCIDFSRFFLDQSFLDMPVQYTKTLGQDRLYQAYYLYSKYCKNSEEQILLNIDAGTFTTIDFITSKGFVGGYIIPGIEILNKTYNDGHLLASASSPPTQEQLEHLPHSTEEAISYGLFKMYQGFLGSLNLQPTSISLTGGKALLLENLIQGIFKGTNITKEPHLIHKALTHIYQQVHA